MPLQGSVSELDHRLTNRKHGRFERSAPLRNENYQQPMPSHDLRSNASL